jgi:putative membrane protein
MSTKIWQHLPLRAALLMIWPALRSEWQIIFGVMAGGSWQLKSASNSALSAWGIPLLFILLALLAGILSWWRFRFSMNDKGVQIRQGFLRRQEVILPFSRILGLQSSQSLLLRLFGLHEVVLESAGSEHEQVILPAVSESMVSRLRAHLQRVAHTEASSVQVPIQTFQASSDAAKPAGAGDVAQPRAGFEFHISWPELLLLSFTSIQTLFVGPFLVGVFYRGTNQSTKAEGAMWEPLYQFAQQHFGVTDEVTRAIMLAIFLFVMTLLLALIWGWWRYGGLHLRQAGNQWQQTSGLIARYTQTLNALRACAVIWKQNPLQAVFGRGWLRVAMMGEDSRQEERNGQSSSFGVPWISYKNCLRMQTRLFEEQVGVTEKAARYQPVSPLYIKQNRRKYVLWPVLLMMGTLTLMNGVENAIMFGGGVGLLWLVVGEIRVRGHYRRLRFAISEASLRVQLGCWGRTRMLLPWSAVQSVCLKQSPLDRRWGLASIEMTVPFGKVKLPCLPLADARVVFDYVASRAILPLDTK